MYCGQIYIAKDAKQLDKQWCLDCVHDVFFAAQGLSAEERSNDRMRQALELGSAALDRKFDDAELAPPESKSDSLEHLKGSES